MTFEPMKSLVHGLGGLQCHCAHGEALGCDVGGGHRSGVWLACPISSSVVHVGAANLHPE